MEFPWAISIILYKVRKRRDVSSRTNRCRHCRAPYWFNYSIQFVGSAEFRGPILEMEQVLLIAPLMLKCLNFLENGFGIKGASRMPTGTGYTTAVSWLFLTRKMDRLRRTLNGKERNSAALRLIPTPLCHYLHVFLPPSLQPLVLLGRASRFSSTSKVRQ